MKRHRVSYIMSIIPSSLRMARGRLGSWCVLQDLWGEAVRLLSVALTRAPGQWSVLLSAGCFSLPYRRVWGSQLDRFRAFVSVGWVRWCLLGCGLGLCEADTQSLWTSVGL